MEISEFMLWKAGFLCVAALCYGFYRGLTDP